LVDVIRHPWPRFMFMKTMMVGCVAGEAQLDGGSDAERAANAELLACAIEKHARALGARLIVLKEFSSNYRGTLACFERKGFTKKFKATASDKVPIELQVSNDIRPVIDEVYSLYLNVYRRSKLHFEKLTKDYFCRLGQIMPERVRYFVWHRNGKAVAFGECIVHGDTMYAEYLGLDYSVALQLHLYHYVFRDLVRWGMANGYKWFQSSALNYDPKLHLRYRLKPVDLYVKHTSSIINRVLRRLLPLLEPTRYDETLKKFPNYSELWETAAPAE